MVSARDRWLREGMMLRIFPFLPRFLSKLLYELIPAAVASAISAAHVEERKEHGEENMAGKEGGQRK